MCSIAMYYYFLSNRNESDHNDDSDDDDDDISSATTIRSLTVDDWWYPNKDPNANEKLTCFPPKSIDVAKIARPSLSGTNVNGIL